MHPLRSRTGKCVFVGALVSALTWGAVVNPGICSASAAAAGGFKTAQAEVNLLVSLVNDEREALSLPPLEVDEDLCLVAAAHAADMIQAKYFGHVSPDGGTLAARLRNAGVSAGKSAENLAGHTSVKAAHDLLMKSPAHRGNILDGELSRVGIAVIRGGPYGLMIVEVFASELK